VKFVVTAGPTREPIDPVRFLSNRSSGKMGYAIAQAAAEAGHQVVLISGPVKLDPPSGIDTISISTADQMYDAVHRQIHTADVVVMCAAVSDYKPAAFSSHKIKKDNETIALKLVRTRDILASLARYDHRNFLLIGFAAETNELEKNARKKLVEKDCDIIIANDVSGAESGMETDENEVTILFRDQQMKKISRAPKQIIARELVKIFANTRENCLTKKMS
jgi:phosphopantothenoylcysteine decarboxylase/phosphopantothenate--cysteine ligase